MCQSEKIIVRDRNTFLARDTKIFSTRTKFFALDQTIFFGRPTKVSEQKENNHKEKRTARKTKEQKMSSTNENKPSTVVRMRYNLVNLAQQNQQNDLFRTIYNMVQTVDGNTIVPLPRSVVGPVLIHLQVENAPCRYSLARVKKESTGGLFGGAKTRVETIVETWDDKCEMSNAQQRRPELRRLVEPEEVPEVFAGLLHDRGIVTLGDANRDLAIQFDGELSDAHVRNLCIRTVVANAWVRENQKTGTSGFWAFE